MSFQQIFFKAPPSMVLDCPDDRSQLHPLPLVRKSFSTTAGPKPVIFTWHPDLQSGSIRFLNLGWTERLMQRSHLILKMTTHSGSSDSGGMAVRSDSFIFDQPQTIQIFHPPCEQ